MVRPKRNRRIYVSPDFKGFAPIGTSNEASIVVMNFEEYEAIRLSDFELLHQKDAAERMAVSRPTFSRIYESARRKVAQAFVTGATIVFEGGKIYFDSNWYYCKSCKCQFNNQNQSVEITECALCGSKNIEALKENSQSDIQEVTEYCYCIRCGHKIAKRRGQLRSQNVCADCNTEL